MSEVLATVVRQGHSCGVAGSETRFSGAAVLACKEVAKGLTMVHTSRGEDGPRSQQRR